jgi:hypothetical protein
MKAATTADVRAQARAGAMHRRADRRRRFVEKVVAALLLFAAFLTTVVLLGLQWLGTPSTTGSAPPTISYTVNSEVHAS